MADHQATEGSSKSNVSGGDSEETVQLNVKTLDSQIYSFCVDKNMPVSLFKEKIADEVGLPVERQRLIFRGKVLKDDHLLSEYHAEDGHTLHLVARQPTEPSAGGISGEATGNNATSGTDAANGPPRNRFGQVSHSVVLGTLNLGEQGNGGMPDLNRVIGAVLNSIGIGGQNLAMGTTTQPTMSAQQGNETGGAQGNIAGQDQAQNRPHGFQPQSATNIPQFFSVPVPAVAQPGPALNLPIPDSLNTIMEFINRMQLALSEDGYRTRETSGETLPTTDLPSTSFGLPTHRALSVVLRHTEQLLNNYVTATISRAAERLDQEADLTDPARRGQLQSESMRLGLVMQHLGALFLEIGRSTLLLRMGQSPGESYVNAGPSVYISANGPNPIMAQPFPMQTSPLFNSSSSQSNPASFGPVGIGNAPRHVNIHIHAGTALAPVGGRAGNADGTQSEQSVSNAPGQIRATQVNNTNGAPMSMGSVSQLVDSGARNPDIVAQINAGIQRQLEEQRIENRNQSGQSAPSTAQTTPGVASVNSDRTSSTPSIAMDTRETKDKEIKNVSDDASSSEKVGKADAVQATPLGLGLGGLQAKKKVKQQKSHVKASDGESSSSNTRSIKMGEGAGGQIDTANLMSQVIQSPALNGLLSGVSQQSGLGSPDVLRNMLTQFTQNPAMANVVNQIAQQVDDQDVGGMLSGMGGQGGVIDFSRMIQQMMPIVSQALGGVRPGAQNPAPAARIESQSQSNQRSISTDDHIPQINVQRVAQSMACGDAPSSIFRGVVENAVQLCNPGNGDLQLIEELCNDPDLTDEFMAMLRRDVSRRVEDESDTGRQDDT
ncbi:unnamed protein product [Rhodiola kirilowii]